jgi:hypothetical protein
VCALVSKLSFTHACKVGSYTTSMVLELQQRAVEYVQLLAAQPEVCAIAHMRTIFECTHSFRRYDVIP